MILIRTFLKELKQKAQTTRKMLSRIPDEDLIPNWTLRTGDEIHSVRSKGD